MYSAHSATTTLVGESADDVVAEVAHALRVGIIITAGDLRVPVATMP
jgi:hypothetical protein